MRVLMAGGGTGGHLMPALAIGNALKDLDGMVDPVFVGAERGVEASILPARSLRHHLLPLQPIYRSEWWRNWLLPFHAVRTSRACTRVLDEERPVLAVGTGGYVAGPVLFWAHRRRIPVVIQEQNAFPGLTTRWLSGMASQVHLGFPEARSLLRPGRGTTVHAFGNPIQDPPCPRPDRDEARTALGLSLEDPVVFVVGGSQGAGSINETVSGLLESGSFEKRVLLWSTGHRTWQEYAHLDDPPRRLVRPFWDPVADAYAAADLVVARSGAMTTAELCAWGVPSILVPLPSAAADHQRKNAEALAQAGAAVHLPERELTTLRLEAEISGLLEDRSKLRAIGAAAADRGRPDAARKIAEEILRLMR